MLKIGLLSAGNICVHMAQTLCAMKSEICLAAVGARDLERAKSFAQKFDIPKAYGSYDELFADKEIDIIYIGCTHNFHYQYAREALLAGKHILCEKPLCVSQKEAQSLIAIAKEQKRVLLDATWTSYMPFVPKLAELLSSGAIGTPTNITASFGFKLEHIQRMTSPQLAGGALLDLGIYPITIALIAFGSDYCDIGGICAKSELGVDTNDVIYLSWKNGRTASLTCNMLSDLPNTAVISGTNGSIELPDFWWAQKIIVHTKNEIKEYDFTHEVSGYEYELRHLISLIENGKTESDILPYSETLRVMQTLDTLRKKWDIKYPFE